MKIYYKQKNKIIKQIKYFKYNIENFNKKIHSLFNLIYNKHAILNRTYNMTLLMYEYDLIKSNLLINEKNNISENDKITVPITHNIILYNFISDKFIYYHIFYNKYLLSLQNIKILDLYNNVGLLEALLYNKINLTGTKYLFYNNYVLVNNKLITHDEELKNRYKSKIQYNNEYMNNKLTIDLIQEIINKNENNYNLLCIDTTIHLQKNVKKEVDYNDYSYMELLYKLYLGLNLLVDGGKCILNMRANLIYNNFLKNLLYFLLNFFDIKYKTIIKYNTQDILLDNFDKNKFTKENHKFKNIIIELENKCIKEQLFLCNTNIPKIIKPKSYEINNLFKYKYNKDFVIFFDYIFDKLNNIKYMKKVKKQVTKICPKLENCFTLEKVLELNYDIFKNNLHKNISLLEKYNLIVYSEYKKLLIDIDLDKYEIPLSNITTFITTNNIINLNYIISHGDIINKFNINIITKNLNLLKFYIESRNVDKWYKISNIINIRNHLSKYINDKYNIKVSKAFCKMYEILTEFPLIDLTKKEIKTFHACEVPGHFINAFNYWIKSRNKDMVFNWDATSLNPSNEENKKKYVGLFSDVYGFISRHKSRWDWGSDNTGDISKRENLLYYERKYKDIDVFTSDCGLGANEEFEQECSLCFLSISQLILGLLVLKIGGHLVCKIFIPFTKPLTLSILYIYTMYFEKIHIIKPSAGSLANSEVYIVGLNKKKHLSEHNKKTLFNVLENIDMNKSLFDNYPFLFIDEINNISKIFIKLQEDFLQKSFYYYDNSYILEKHKNELFYDAKMKYVNKWINNNNFKLIEDTL